MPKRYDYDSDIKLPRLTDEDIEAVYGRGSSRDPEIVARVERIRREMRRRYHVEHPDRPLELIPAAEADDSYGHPIPGMPTEGRGPTSSAIAGRLSWSCAGWTVSPTAAEFYEAARSEAPNSDQQVILDVLLSEGDQQDWLQAWCEGAFTWRQMIRAAHALGKPSHDLVQWINLMAERRLR